MTTPIAPVAAFSAYQPQRPAEIPTPVAADAAAAAPPAPAPRKAAEPLALSVDRDASGVFVYTLTDSASGRVVAVIPRSAVASSAQASGAGVDIQA